MPASRRKSKSLQKGKAAASLNCAGHLTPSRRYTDAVERHFRESVLDALPARYDSLLQQIEDNQAGSAYDMGACRACTNWHGVVPDTSPGAAVVPEPYLDGHVFCRILEDKGDIEIDE